MIPRFVDRDMVMRYHWGLGVGHVYTHNQRVEAGIPRDQEIERGEQVNNQDEDDHHSLETGEINLLDERSDSDSESAESTDNDAEDDIFDYEN